MEARARRIAAVGLLLLVATAGVGLALTGGVFTTGTVTLEATDGPQVDVVTSSESQILLDGPDGANTVEVVHEDGEIVFSSSAPTQATVQSGDITGTYTVVSGIDASNVDLTINPGDKRPVTVGGGITSVEFRNATVNDGATDFRYSADSTASVTVNGLPADTTLIAVDADTGAVLDQTTTDSSGTATWSNLDSGDHNVQIAENRDPNVDDSSAAPAGNETVTDTPVELSIDVSDPAFGTTQGDSVEVTFYDASDDSVLGTDTLTSNGTATTTVSDPQGGENSWYVVVSDSFDGQTTSSTFTYNAPSELRVFEETNPSQLIDEDVTLRVRFFVEGEETVIERETSNGIISLEGLPVNKRFIVTVRANETGQYTYRRIVVDSLIDQQDVYLLNTSEPNSQIVFQLDDPTGQFPPEETTLYVEKPLTKDFDDDGTNETQYVTIAGDTFGAAAEFPVVLQDKVRYRLRVESKTGSSRILGAYSVAGDDIQPLQIERIEPKGNVSSGSALFGGIETNDAGERVLAIRYIDPDEETTSVKYRVINNSDGSVWIENTTRESNSFADLYPLPANASESASYTVEYEIVRNGQTTTGEFYAGALPGVAGRFGITARTLGIVSYVAILSTMGLFVIVNPRLGPIGGAGMATVLTILGTVSIPAPILGISGAISVLVLFGGRS